LIALEHGGEAIVIVRPDDLEDFAR
jgi:hypothetical protein